MAEQMICDLAAETKVCGDCKQLKPIAEFNKHYGKPRSHCKVCHSAYSSKWNDKNRSWRKTYVEGWHMQNPERVSGYKRKYEAALTQEQLDERREYARWHMIKKNYGLTKEEWLQKVDAQGGLCALCKIPGRTGKLGRLSVDHCHVTGRVRGLLCSPCNSAIGVLGDTPEMLERAVKYLRSSP